MKLTSVAPAMAGTVLFLVGAFAFAATPPTAPPPAASKPAPPKKGDAAVKPASGATSGTHANVKLVDINSASAAELKTLPGIGGPQAAKIIAGRPYGSKAHLVTRNVIDEGTYEGIKQRIIAKQPYKDGAKNAALYAPKK